MDRAPCGATDLTVRATVENILWREIKTDERMFFFFTAFLNGKKKGKKDAKHNKIDG